MSAGSKTPQAGSCYTLCFVQCKQSRMETSMKAETQQLALWTLHHRLGREAAGQRQKINPRTSQILLWFSELSQLDD